MLKKILIANRGEIALRIIRACKELGIKTIAVYSEADVQSLHVQLADEAICIGPALATQSYLRIDRIISAAELTNTDAIHPGYGFLSENPSFAEKCQACNFKFIGPTSKTIEEMGNKAKAKEIAKKAGAPIIPGSNGPVKNTKDAIKIAEKIKFPVIIKAVSGGGGKGMRLANDITMLKKEFEYASIEAKKNFGQADVYIEKYIEEPRHIEFQILADQKNNIIHLGERDCSVQRRYQKLIEEAPSPYLTPVLRKEMGEIAIKIAQACNYQNAGTIEFLVDKNENFYFIEMNTRIQVEHGVTEEITDVDLIKWQILIANDENLKLKQKDINFNRHAIECRINAENPIYNFAPSPGKINLYYPPGGHGIRIDSHCYGGYEIPPYYDSMIGKIIAYGANRNTAIKRMNRALSEYLIRGIKTTIPFANTIIQDSFFKKGNITTNYIKDFLYRTPKEKFK